VGEPEKEENKGVYTPHPCMNVENGIEKIN